MQPHTQNCHEAMTFVWCFRKEGRHGHILGNPSSRNTVTNKEREVMKGTKKPEEKKEMK